MRLVRVERYEMTQLTQTERGAYTLEKREKRCKACRNGQLMFALEPYRVVICRIGKAWPKRGMCKSFED